MPHVSTESGSRQDSSKSAGGRWKKRPRVDSDADDEEEPQVAPKDCLTLEARLKRLANNMTEATMASFFDHLMRVRTLDKGKDSAKTATESHVREDSGYAEVIMISSSSEDLVEDVATASASAPTRAGARGSGASGPSGSRKARGV